MPTANREYDVSRKADNSKIGPVFLGGSRGFINATLTAVIPSIRKPKARIVHGKSILGSNVSTIAGKTIPPVALPLAAIAIAMPRFFVKYVEISARAGQKSKPPPMPVHKP